MDVSALAIQISLRHKVGCFLQFFFLVWELNFTKFLLQEQRSQRLASWAEVEGLNRDRRKYLDNDSRHGVCLFVCLLKHHILPAKQSRLCRPYFTKTKQKALNSSTPGRGIMQKRPKSCSLVVSKHLSIKTQPSIYLAGNSWTNCPKHQRVKNPRPGGNPDSFYRRFPLPAPGEIKTK